MRLGHILLLSDLRLGQSTDAEMEASRDLKGGAQGHTEN